MYKIICYFKGILRSIKNWPDFKIKGHDYQEFPGGHLECITCGHRIIAVGDFMVPEERFFGKVTQKDIEWAKAEIAAIDKTQIFLQDDKIYLYNSETRKWSESPKSVDSP